MKPSNTITVNELIEILKLYPPDELISFETEYTMSSRKAWDRYTLFAGNKSVIDAYYEWGKLIKVKPIIKHFEKKYND